jgi:hypothetical protein
LHEYAFTFWSYHVAGCLKYSSLTEYGSKNVASLALKIKNSCLFPDVDLYHDGAPLREFVTTIMAQHMKKDELESMLPFLFVMPPTGTPVWAPLELGQLRMLVLRPAQDPQEPVCCDLFVDATENEPNYTCLSYVWGDTSHQRSIRINRTEWLVTLNLLSALIVLRSGESPRAMLLWIDQLCINQWDDTEKAHQVSEMSSIYHQAREVRAWLGPKDGTVEED